MIRLLARVIKTIDEYEKSILKKSTTTVRSKEPKFYKQKNYFCYDKSKPQIGFGAMRLTIEAFYYRSDINPLKSFWKIK